MFKFRRGGKKGADATIFISICAYRDPELRKTIADCLAQADHPERLHFGICNQYDHDSLIEASEFPNTRIISAHFSQARGLGWARAHAQSLYGKEAFLLQLDAHMRFRRGWDEYHVSLFRQAVRDGIPRPILTAACPASEPEKKQLFVEKGTKIGFKRFYDRGTIEYQPDWLSEDEQRLAYVRGVFVSGHYLFTAGEFAEEYRFDPNIYFGGEETSLSVRSYTMGYDVIHPGKSFVYHNYSRMNRPLHWLDHVAKEREQVSTLRLRQLLEIEDNGIDLGAYGLGTRRPLDGWIAASGIDIRRSRILSGNQVK